MAKKGSKLISTLIAVLIAVAFLLSCFFVFGTFLNKDKKIANADYNLVNRNIETAYYNHSVFTISAIDTFQYFAESVGAGYSYEGKTVKLLCDIDCLGNTLGVGGGGSGQSFAGTFDGQGNTISNYEFSYGGEKKVGGDGTFSYDLCRYYGLFERITDKATIKNLKVSDVANDFNCDDTTYKTIGAIVGVSDGGKIDNCIVENITINFTDVEKESRVNLAGVFGGGSATVTNCFVRNITSGYRYYAIGPALRDGFKKFKNSYTTAVETENVYNTNPSTYSNNFCDNAWYSADTKYGVVTRDCYTNGLWGVEKSTESYNHNYTHCYSSTTDSGFADWVKNFKESGTYDDIKKNYWYYNPFYNGGFPCLRMFISSWKSVTVKVNDNTQGYLKYNNEEKSQFIFSFPTDMTVPISSSNDELSVSEFIITAKAKEGCLFNKWENNIAYFKPAEFTFSFKMPEQLSSFTVTINGVNSTKKSFTCEYGVSVIYNQPNRRKEELSISFKDASNNSIEVYYEVNKSYHFTHFKTTINSSTQTYGIRFNQYYELKYSSGSLEFTPIVELKTYKVTFK